MGNRLSDLDEGSTRLLDRYLNGDRSDDLRSKLRGVLRETRGLTQQYDRFKKSEYDGLQDWWPAKMTEIVSVCQVTLQALIPQATRPDPVPQAFRAIPLPSPAE